MNTRPFDLHQAVDWIDANIVDGDGPYHGWWNGGVRSQDPVRILEYGQGLCSDKTIVLTTMAMESGLDARTLELDGHVVAEIEVSPSVWRVADPDFGLVFDASYAELVTTHRHLLEAYDESVAALYLTTRNNQIHPSAELNARHALVEENQIAAAHFDLAFLSVGLLSTLALIAALILRRLRASA